MHRQLPGVRMLLNSEVDTNHQVARFHWLQHQANGTIIHRTDFVEFNEANTLSRVTSFFGKLESIQP
jgi:hypothetical protein